MKRIFKYISGLGVNQEQSIYEQRSNTLLNQVSLLLILFFGFIAVMTVIKLDSPVIFFLFAGNVLFIIFTLFLNQYGYSTLSKYILSGIIPVSFLFVGAYAKSIGVTNNLMLYLSPRMLITITAFLPILLFGIHRKKHMFLASILPTLAFVFYDKVHNFFGIYVDKIPVESEAYPVFLGMIVMYFFSVIGIIIFLQQLNFHYEIKLSKNNEGLKKANYEVNVKNNELISAEEELRQQNEEIITINNHLNENKSFIEQQNTELNNLKQAVNQSAMSILITDIQGNIIYVNKHFEILTGYSTIEVLGQKTNVLKSGKHNDEFYKSIWTTVLAAKTWSGEIQNKRKDGSVYWEYNVISPVINSAGEISNFIASKEDITDKKEAEQKLIDAHKIIEKKNLDLTGSINYAKTIQKAVLPKTSDLKLLETESFVFFKPRDVVSGDFWYIEKLNSDKVIIAVADCTGHGVPGAFLTMLGYNTLQYLINAVKIVNPSDILNELRKKIISILSDGRKNFRDGMDMAICSYNKKNLTIDYAGANRPLIIIRNNEIIQYKPDKMPIGLYHKEKPYTCNTIQLQKNDIVYMYSDGYTDQFGGSDNRKLTSNRFKEVLLKIHTKTLENQKEILAEFFNKWKIDNNQTDDVIVLGFKVE